MQPRHIPGRLLPSKELHRALQRRDWWPAKATKRQSPCQHFSEQTSPYVESANDARAIGRSAMSMVTPVSHLSQQPMATTSGAEG
jgi:hypothetical protein